MTTVDLAVSWALTGNVAARIGFAVCLAFLLLKLIALLLVPSQKLQTAEEIAAAAPPENIRGKSFIVTGASSGIGEETARVLARYGATAVVATRNKERGEAAVDRINEDIRNQHGSSAGTRGKAVFRTLDLASFSSVNSFANDWATSQPNAPLAAIILNAGLVSPTFATTTDGIEANLQACICARACAFVRARLTSRRLTSCLANLCVRVCAFVRVWLTPMSCAWLTSRPSITASPSMSDPRPKR